MNFRRTIVLCGLIAATTLPAAKADAQQDVAPATRPATAPADGGGSDAPSLAAARESLAAYEKGGRYADLDAAWGRLRDPLTKAANADDSAEALRLAADIIPRLRMDAVKPWLDACVDANPERALAVVAALGKPMSSLANNPDRRGKLLKLQSAALNAYVTRSAPPLPEAAKKLATSFTGTWMEEADASRREAANAAASGGSPRSSGIVRPGSPAAAGPRRSGNAIAVYELIDAAPGDKLIASLEPNVQVALLDSLVRTCLVEAEEAAAFGYIERLAATTPATAGTLIVEFINAWTRNHNPNSANPNANNPNAQSVQVVTGPNGQQTIVRGAAVMPITRSLQQENLDDLAGWVARIRKLPVPQPEEALLVQAFISCHTPNAVYSVASLNAVLGPPEKLKSESLQRLAEQMRASVNTARAQLAQQQKSTRRPEDLKADVLAGYAVIRSLLDGSLSQRPRDWKLALSRAVIAFDELDFQRDVKPTAEFAARRGEVMDEFARVAGMYASQVDDRMNEAPTLTVFEQWFAAALGATELQNLTEAVLPDLRQPARIRAAMLALPGEAGERHLAEFAASLFPRVGQVKPAMKPRYLRMGAEVVDNHPRLGQAKKLLKYYADLSKEMKLDVRVDGSPAVGSMEPFGVIVQLRHTKELEQGSGGFGRFLQNQVGNMGMYNPGRPQANYRDRFENAMNSALAEHFEVMSCTFESDKVVSRPTAEEGWRTTPYAYLLLKAKGRQVDRLPPLQFDLDFMDAAGFVVLAIESPAVPLDAGKREPRPADRLTVVQTIDERKAATGELKLEVKATANGIAPDLDRLLTPIPAGFEVVKNDARGPSVVKFESDATTTAAVTERNWLLTLRAKPGQAGDRFRFPTAATPGTDVKLQRYQDADIVPATAEIEVGSIAAASNLTRNLLVGGATAILLTGIILWIVLRGRGRNAHVPIVPVGVPAHLTPVTALGYLRAVADRGQVPPPEQGELQQAIRQLEAAYFSGDAGHGDPPPLASFVERWSRAPQAHA